MKKLVNLAVIMSIILTFNACKKDKTFIEKEDIKNVEQKKENKENKSNFEMQEIEDYVFSENIEVLNKNGDKNAVIKISSNNEQILKKFLNNTKIIIEPVYSVEQPAHNKIFKDSLIYNKSDKTIKNDIIIEMTAINFPEKIFGYKMIFKNNDSNKAKTDLITGTVYGTRGQNMVSVNFYSGFINWIKWYGKIRLHNRWTYLKYNGYWDENSNYSGVGCGWLHARWMKISMQVGAGSDYVITWSKI